MTADAGLYESYAIAHRLRIGVLQPFTCIDDMPYEEYDGWAAYFYLIGEQLRLKEKS